MSYYHDISYLLVGHICQTDWPLDLLSESIQRLGARALATTLLAPNLSGTQYASGNHSRAHEKHEDPVC